MDRLKRLLEWGGIRKDATLLVLGAASLALSMAGWRPNGVDPAWGAIVLCGLPIILEALVGLITEFDITADVLVSVALTASVAIGETFAAGEIAFIMQLGALLEETTVAKARAGTEKLLRLTPRLARRVAGGVEESIDATEVRVGDVLRVLPGETIPADGTVVAGATAVDQSIMTGEPLPVDKTPGDAVISGTVNRLGSFDMRADRAGQDSTVQRMIRLVQSADAGRAKIVRIADRWAVWIVIGALSAALLAWLTFGQIIRAVTILVVFCPCALVLATPTAIIAAIGNATRHGFLVRQGDALERLADVTTVTFDKTGTLTLGQPHVAEVKSYCDLPDEELWRLLAAAERRSEHPLGKTLVRDWNARGDSGLPAANCITVHPGKGIEASVTGYTVLAGTEKLMSEHHVAIPAEALAGARKHLDDGHTITWTAVDGKFAGYAAYTDTLRGDASAMLHRLKNAGITPVLLTGDSRSAARTAAEQLGIAELHAECLPQDKLDYINACQDAGNRICMIGDGINDAPALKTAHVSIAMGDIGSDIAVDAADITLTGSRLRELPHIIRLARHMAHVIRVDLTFSLTLNLVAVVLAAAGILTPVAGALVHNAGSILVIINSALLLNWKG